MINVCSEFCMGCSDFSQVLHLFCSDFKGYLAAPISILGWLTTLAYMVLTAVLVLVIIFWAPPSLSIISYSAIPPSWEIGLRQPAQLSPSLFPIIVTFQSSNFKDYGQISNILGRWHYYRHIRFNETVSNETTRVFCLVCDCVYYVNVCLFALISSSL